MFKSFFPHWDENYGERWLEGDRYAKEVAALKAQKAAAFEEKWSQPAAKVEEGKYLDPETNKFDVEELKKGIPAGVDPARKQLYLSAEQFEATFGETLESFKQKKEWKQKDIKKDKGLF